MTAAIKLKDSWSLEEQLWQTYTTYWKAETTLLTKVQNGQSYGFSSTHGWMWELDHKEGWALKNWCFLTVLLEKSLESPLDSKEIMPVNPKGNQPWIFIGRTDAKAEAPILCPPYAMCQLIWKRPWCWERLRQEEKGTTEDEMVGWHHRLSGHGFGQTPGDGEGQGRLACCSPWGHRVGHDWVTEHQQRQRQAGLN